MNVAAFENLKVWGKTLTLFCEKMKKGYLAAQFQIAFNCVNHFLEGMTIFCTTNTLKYLLSLIYCRC